MEAKPSWKVTYVVLVDLDADVEHLTVGVGIGVVAADHFAGARERRGRHVVVVVVGRTARFALHQPLAQHQRQA